MRFLVIDHPRPLHPEHWNDVANAPLSASLNAGYALAVAAAAGHETTYLDFNLEAASPEEMARQALEADPECVLIHWVHNWDNGASVTSLIRRLRDDGYTGCIGSFGVFPSFCSAELLEDNPGLDFALVGEFESTLADILRNGSVQRALDAPPPGLHSRRGFGGARALIAELDRLPFPWDAGRTAALSQVNVAASRGCYGACTFCCIQPFYGPSRWRPRSVDNVLAEVQQRATARGKDHLYFVDPNFFGPGQSGQERARELGTRLAGLAVRFGLEARVNDIYPETIAVLRDAGLESVFLGVESASEAVLERMNKRITTAQSALAIQRLREAGVFVNTGFIMFEPDSALEDVRVNLGFLEENGLLEHPDQSSNVLHHSQIILKGSLAYATLERQDRLEFASASRYEAHCRYLHADVKAMADAVGQIVLCYFRHFDRFWRQQGLSKLESDASAHCLSCPQVPTAGVNDLLVGSFRECLAAASRGGLEELPAISAAAMTALDALFAPPSAAGQ